MSADGAHMGITAGRALETILGGKPSPDEGEQMSAAKFCAWLRSAPDRVDGLGTADGYTETGRVMARYLLLLLDEDPSAINLDAYALIERAGERFPVARETISELTGFLAGWAVNAARRCLEMPAVPNPAILNLPPSS